MQTGEIPANLEVMIRDEETYEMCFSHQTKAPMVFHFPT